MTGVLLTGLGTYLPDERRSGEAVAERAGLPESVVTEQMGLREKRLPSDGDHPSDMCVAAATTALADAGLDAAALDLVLYHGSEYKDYVVWSAAADVADRIGAVDAVATESYSLCAGAPIALRTARALLREDHLDRALLVAASREGDLVDYDDEDASFTFNFGAGACATVLEAAAVTDDGDGRDADGSIAEVDRTVSPVADRARARVWESAARTDGSFSRDVIVPAGGTRNPPSRETVDRGLHALSVPDHDRMKERLAGVSLPNFLSVADAALERSGYDRADLTFAAITHVKRSFHERLVDELGVGAAGSHYLDEVGHVQSADQVLAVERGLSEGKIEPGDVVLLLAAGTGYTWAATVLEWLG